MTVLWFVPAVVLLVAAATKAADPRPSALATYAVPRFARVPLWTALVVAEASLAAGIAAGNATAAYLAGVLLAGFLIAQLAALARGPEGAPCGCFTPEQELSRRSAGRTALLAIVCAVLPIIGSDSGVPLSLSGVVAVAALVLAAAVGRGVMLRAARR